MHKLSPQIFVSRLRGAPAPTAPLATPTKMNQRYVHFQVVRACILSYLVNETLALLLIVMFIMDIHSIIGLDDLDPPTVLVNPRNSDRHVVPHVQCENKVR